MSESSGERLQIEVDFAVQTAVENASTLVEGLDQLTAKTNEAGAAVERTEAAVTKLGAKSEGTAAKVKEVGEATGAAAGGLKEIEKKAGEADDALDDVAKSAGVAADEIKDVGTQGGKAADGGLAAVAKATEKVTTEVKELGGAASGTAKELVDTGRAGDAAAGGGLKKVQQAADDAGDALTDAGRKGKKGTSEIGDGSSLAGRAVDDLAGRAKNLVATFMGLGGALQLLREMEEQAKRTIEARDKLAGDKLSFLEKTAELVDNLGLGGDPNRDARASNVVTTFQRTTGSTPEQAVQILSMASANNLPIVDPDRPELDAKMAGFDVATEMGLFAARLRLPAPDAAELMKVAVLSGVKDRSTMQRFLSQIESGQAETPINSPGQFVSGFLKIAGPLVSQGVPFAEALGLFAAAASGKSDASEAATDAKQFSRVAAGTDPQRTLTLARIAMRQGRLSEQAIGAEVEGTVRPRMAVENAAELQTEREADERDRREIADAEKRLAAVRKERGPTLNLIEKRARRSKSVIERESAVVELETRTRAFDEQETSLSQQISDRQAAITRRARTRAQEERDAATVSAYKALPQSVKLAVLRDATVGMSPSERSKVVASFTEGDMAESVNFLTSDTARAKFESAREAVSTADPATIDERNKVFRTSGISQAARSDTAITLADVEATGPGEQYAELIRRQAKAKVTREQAAGRGGVGWGHGLVSLFSPGSGTFIPEGQEASQGAGILLQRMRAFVASMSPQQRERHPELDAIIREYAGSTVDAQGEPTGLPYRSAKNPILGNRANVILGDYAAKFGRLRARVQAEALERGERLPAGDEPEGSVREQEPPKKGEDPQSSAGPLPERFASTDDTAIREAVAAWAQRNAEADALAAVKSAEQNVAIIQANDYWDVPGGDRQKEADLAAARQKLADARARRDDLSKRQRVAAISSSPPRVSPSPAFQPLLTRGHAEAELAAARAEESRQRAAWEVEGHTDGVLPGGMNHPYRQAITRREASELALADLPPMPSFEDATARPLASLDIGRDVSRGDAGSVRSTPHPVPAPSGPVFGPPVPVPGDTAPTKERVDELRRTMASARDEWTASTGGNVDGAPDAYRKYVVARAEFENAYAAHAGRVTRSRSAVAGRHYGPTFQQPAVTRPAQVASASPTAQPGPADTAFLDDPGSALSTPGVPSSPSSSGRDARPIAAPTYNITIGSLVTPAGGEFDFPGRLEDFL